MDFFGLGLMEILLILIIALLLFGPAKLPEIGAAVGRGLRELRKASSELTKNLSKDFVEETKEEMPKAKKGPEKDNEA